MASLSTPAPGGGIVGKIGRRSNLSTRLGNQRRTPLSDGTMSLDGPCASFGALNAGVGMAHLQPAVGTAMTASTALKSPSCAKWGEKN